MNKYQKALWNIIQRLNEYSPTDNYGQDLIIIQELVDKATPMRPRISKIDEKLTLCHCPECDTYVGSRDKNYLYYSDVDKYCKYCGQTINQDWSEEND